MKQAKFYTPVITAFDEQGAIDKQANIRLWEHIIAGGIDGIVLLGSSGEFCSLREPQKNELIALAAEHLPGRTEWIVGTGGMSPADTVALSNHALEAGADAVMVVSPYYFALTDASIESFYDEIALGVNGRIYLYNYPERTGYDIAPAVALRLLRKHSNLIGYKDSVSDFSHTRSLLTAVRGEFPDFAVFSGFDENLAHNLLSGGSGCIGGLSNVYPEVFSAWVRAINRGDVGAMAAYQRLVDRMMDLYAIGTPFMPAVRKAVQLRGVPVQEFCTAPLLPVNSAQTEAIRTILAEVDAFLAAKPAL